MPLFYSKGNGQAFTFAAGALICQEYIEAKLFQDLEYTCKITSRCCSVPMHQYRDRRSRYIIIISGRKLLSVKGPDIYPLAWQFSYLFDTDILGLSESFDFVSYN